MKKFILGFLTLFIAQNALAQVQPMYYSTPTTHTCTSGQTCAPLTDSHGEFVPSSTFPLSVNIVASTTGGWSTYAALGGTGNALLTSTAVAIKTSAGALGGVDFVNTGIAAAYVQIFDVASGSVTLGTTVPKMAKWVPAGGAWEEKFQDEGIAFTTAITVAATTTTTGLTAPSTGINANIEYK